MTRKLFKNISILLVSAFFMNAGFSVMASDLHAKSINVPAVGVKAEIQKGQSSAVSGDAVKQEAKRTAGSVIAVPAHTSVINQEPKKVAVPPISAPVVKLEKEKPLVNNPSQNQVNNTEPKNAK